MGYHGMSLEVYRLVSSIQPQLVLRLFASQLARVEERKRKHAVGD
jgi:hypothetical protein